MDDDFNTADAISAIFEMVRDINAIVAPATNPTKVVAQACYEAFMELCEVLGIPFEQVADLDAEIEAMIEARQAARKAKNFKEADRIRDELKAMGIILMDTPQGVKWSRE